MGRLVYGASKEVELDDRVLAHLKVVVLSKLRRGESLALSWTHDVSRGSDRSTIWVHPSASLQFVFGGSAKPELDRELVERLIDAANSPEGINLHGE